MLDGLKLEELIKQYVHEYSEKYGKQTRWEQPLVGYADAQDGKFKHLKEIVSPTHALPEDFLVDAKTVIAYFLPFDRRITLSNLGGDYGSREWAVAYVETNQLIYDLNTYISEVCKSAGYSSTVIPATHNFDESKLISDWSHRHIAWIAGLGKFGLNNMLITAKGCGGRLGSIVTNLEISPTSSVEGEYCLYKAKGTCKLCVSHCVGDSLKTDSFNRHKCYEVLLDNDKRHPDLGLADICGKCVVGLPCTFRNPVSHG